METRTEYIRLQRRAVVIRGMEHEQKQGYVEVYDFVPLLDLYVLPATLLCAQLWLRAPLLPELAFFLPTQTRALQLQRPEDDDLAGLCNRRHYQLCPLSVPEPGGYSRSHPSRPRSAGTRESGLRPGSHLPHTVALCLW
jgi:hypothetical protein